MPGMTRAKTIYRPSFSKSYSTSKSYTAKKSSWFAAKPKTVINQTTIVHHTPGYSGWHMPWYHAPVVVAPIVVGVPVVAQPKDGQ